MLKDLGHGVLHSTWQAAQVLQDVTLGTSAVSTAFVTLRGIAQVQIAQQVSFGWAHTVVLLHP